MNSLGGIEARLLHDRCDECVAEDVRKMASIQRAIEEFDDKRRNQIDDLLQNVRRNRVGGR